MTDRAHQPEIVVDLAWVAAGGVVVLMLVASVFLYFVIGWGEMEDRCVATGGAGRDSVTYSYSWWNPTGFTCTYADGTTQTFFI